MIVVHGSHDILLSKRVRRREHSRHCRARRTERSPDQKERKILKLCVANECYKRYRGRSELWILGMFDSDSESAHVSLNRPSKVYLFVCLSTTPYVLASSRVTSFDTAQSAL